MDKKDTKKAPAAEPTAKQPKENKKVNPSWAAAERLQGALIIVDHAYFEQ